MVRGHCRSMSNNAQSIHNLYSVTNCISVSGRVIVCVCVGGGGGGVTSIPHYIITNRTRAISTPPLGWLQIDKQ